MKENIKFTNTPLTVFFNITDMCNLRCIYCIAECPTLQKKEISDSVIKRVINELKRNTVFKVIITGGEPFILPKIEYYLSELSKSHKLCLLSNGTLIDLKIAQFLYKNNIHDICISLDGPNEKINSITRGRGSFKMCINGINNLIRNNIIPKILFTPTRYNYSIFNQYVKFLIKLGIKEVSINRLHFTGRAKKVKNSIYLAFEDLKRFHQIIQETRMQYKDITICEKISNLFELKENRSSKYLVRKILQCSAGVTQCAINANGDVFPCNNFADFKCGNLITNSLVDIWTKSDKFELLRKLRNADVKSRLSIEMIKNGECIADIYSQGINIDNIFEKELKNEKDDYFTYAALF